MDKIRVFIVDDHILLRRGLYELVSHERDMEVVGEAENGLEAVRSVHALHPDIVLMDIVMPGLNGIQAAKKISRDHPEIRFLFLSGYDNEEYITAAFGLNTAGYVLKNSDTGKVLQAIRCLFKGESFIEPSVMDKMLYTLKAGKPKKPVKNGKALSRRELKIVELGAGGLTNRQISRYLNLSPRTVHAHWRNIFRKLHTRSRVEAVTDCLKKGLVTL
jgi:NarL family two-component system response regulator LiaR